MHTYEQAVDVLVRMANNAGRRGLKLYQWDILPPATGTGSYSIMLDARPLTDATEKWDA